LFVLETPDDGRSLKTQFAYVYLPVIACYEQCFYCHQHQKKVGPPPLAQVEIFATQNKVMRCGTVQCGGYVPTFRKTMLPLSSVVKWRWRQHGVPKRWYPTTTLHGATTKKTRDSEIKLEMCSCQSSRTQNSHNIKTVNRSLENVAKFRYLGNGITN